MPKQVFYKISKDRQMKLIKPALKEFVKKPYEKITVQSLTATMKILRTDFYYYFLDKDDIYNGVLENFQELVKKTKEDADFQEALEILFENLIQNESPRFRQYLIELTDSYNPQFAIELSNRLRKMFGCQCEGDIPPVKARMKIYRFLTVLNLYEKGELKLESARELIYKK